MKALGMNGFIFTKLLTVIASIVLLILLLLPAIQSAKKKAQQARCLSNMRQIALAIYMFAAEHDLDLPAAGRCGRSAEFDWTWGGNVVPLPQTDPTKCERVRVEDGVLWPYVTGMPRVGTDGQTTTGLKNEWFMSTKNNVYLCPTAGPVGRKRGLSYSMNCRLDVSQDGGTVIGIKLSRIRRPSKTVLLVDESDQTLNDGYFDPAGPENKSPDVHLKHRGGGNIVFCDGHVAWLQKKRFLMVMDPKSDCFSPDKQ